MQSSVYLRSAVSYKLMSRAAKTFITSAYLLSLIIEGLIDRLTRTSDFFKICFLTFEHQTFAQKKKKRGYAQSKLSTAQQQQ